PYNNALRNYNSGSPHSSVGATSVAGRCSDTRPGIWGNPLGNAAAVRCPSPTEKGPHLRVCSNAGGGTRTPDTRIMMGRFAGVLALGRASRFSRVWLSRGRFAESGTRFGTRLLWAPCGPSDVVPPNGGGSGPARRPPCVLASPRRGELPGGAARDIAVGIASVEPVAATEQGPGIADRTQ